VFAFFISLGVAALGEHVVDLLFGELFLPSAPLLKIGIFALIPLSAWKILANDFIGRGLLAHYAASATVGSTSIISLNYLLLSRYGVIAAPWVLIVSYSISACMLIKLAHYRLGISWSIPPNLYKG
jgi:O-antigen/teichoic acid export membrane protein